MISVGVETMHEKLIASSDQPTSLQAVIKNTNRSMIIKQRNSPVRVINTIETKEQACQYNNAKLQRN